ncbi:GNAT family N-acetyltransferase [Corynebacterium sp. H78]|uniref:GNAT family N-acetyltransferase n=1 Tax=Corynebacterium sp. H78 TaxID=3133417 RepID=UPI0030A375EA
MCDCIIKRFDELTPTEVYAISALRTDVFYLEQQCAEPEMDWRDLEPTTQHIFIMDAQSERRDSSGAPCELAAYLRVITTIDDDAEEYPMTIGRVVVKLARRGEGLAEKLMQTALGEHPGQSIVLHAQTQAKGLYTKCGFVEVGDVFVEAGIEHITMVRKLNRDS